jgi:dienelactone hydrolase
MDWRGEFYRHDRKLPLDAEEKILREDERGVRLRVEFTSMHEHRVPGILTIPRGLSRPPVALILHGLTGSKEAPYVKGMSRLLVNAGFATISLDAQYHGDRSRTDRDMRFHHFTSYTNRNAALQTGLDCMRALDYAASRDDLDAERIGFVGFSQGTIVGTPFCARDERVRAVALVVGGGDFLKMYPPAPNPAARERAERIAATIDPVHHAAGIAPRPLLMVNATRDDLVPRASTEALFAAAREPKRILWFESTHQDLPREAFEEVVRFMKMEVAAAATPPGGRTG